MGTIARGAKAGGGTNYNTGQAISPTEVNDEQNDVFGVINGGLDDANIETGTIPGAKTLRFTEQTTPTVPASNDLLAYALDVNGRSMLAVLDSGGLERFLGSLHPQAENQTEVTIATATPDTTIQTITVNIPAADGCLVVASLRKTTGAAAAAEVGLAINGTVVLTDGVWSSAANAAEAGLFVALIWRRLTNYVGGGFALVACNAVVTPTLRGFVTASIPNAAITSITIVGNSGNAAITMGVEGAAVYRLYGT